MVAVTANSGVAVAPRDVRVSAIGVGVAVDVIAVEGAAAVGAVSGAAAGELTALVQAIAAKVRMLTALRNADLENIVYL